LDAGGEDIRTVEIKKNPINIGIKKDKIIKKIISPFL
jgi:hypothetical protein